MKKEIDENVFCDEFYLAYNLEINLTTLNEKEKTLFYQLSKVVGRFSPFEDDLANYPGVYYDKAELDTQINSTIKELGIK